MVSDKFLVKRTSDAADLIRIGKSIYDNREESDGTRILVMRTWPRGVKKTSIDTWMKDLGTQKELIKLWKSVPLEEFRRRYLDDLRKNKIAMELANEIADRVSKGNTVTLLCTEKDPEHCHRSFLKEVIVGLLH